MPCVGNPRKVVHIIRTVEKNTLYTTGNYNINDALGGTVAHQIDLDR